MKWLQKIIGGREKKTAGIADLQAYLDSTALDDGFDKSLEEIYARMTGVLEDLRRDIEGLGKADPDADAPPRLLKAGLAARSDVQRPIRSLLERTAPPKELSLTSSTEYYSGLVKALERTVTMFARAQRYTAALFPGEVEEINSDLAEMSRLLVDLDHALDKRRLQVKEAGDLRETLSRSLSGRKQIAALKGEIRAGENQLVDMRARERALEQDRSSWTASETGLRAEALRAEIDERRLEVGRIDDEAIALISPLSKALSRMAMQESRDSGGDSKGMEHAKYLEALARRPLEALDITPALMEMRSCIDALGLRDRKKDKVVDQIDLLIADRPLDALRARRSALLSEIAEMEPRLYESLREGRRLDEEIAVLHLRISQAETGQDAKRKELSYQEDRLIADEDKLKALAEKALGRPLHLGDEG